MQQLVAVSRNHHKTSEPCPDGFCQTYTTCRWPMSAAFTGMYNWTTDWKNLDSLMEELYFTDDLYVSFKTFRGNPQILSTIYQWERHRNMERMVVVRKSVWKRRQDQVKGYKTFKHTSVVAHESVPGLADSAFKNSSKKIIVSFFYEKQPLNVMSVDQQELFSHLFRKPREQLESSDLLFRRRWSEWCARGCRSSTKRPTGKISSQSKSSVLASVPATCRRKSSSVYQEKSFAGGSQLGVKTGEVHCEWFFFFSLRLTKLTRPIKVD